MSEIDDVNTEIDKRKLTKLVDNGVISAEDLANAPIVVECSNCKYENDIDNYQCEDCGEEL